MVPEIGALLGAKYRVLDKLGEGGMGTVFRAENELTGKHVAIKWMHPHLAANPDAAERMLREARAASKLTHPNVVDVYDVVRDEQTLFLVMELLQGETLREYLRHNPNPKLSEYIGLLLGAMAGVAAAHQHGVIHRDLKPDNIFLERVAGIPLPTAKVVDFGIAKLAEIRGSTLTETGAAIGTPVYMSLEQLRGDKDIDARTDVYAFGVMLYEAVIGRMPYTAATLPELAIKVATTDAIRVRSLRPDVPAALANAIDRAIARDRTLRWPDMPSLIHQLTPFATESGYRAQPSLGGAWPTQPPRPTHTHASQTQAGRTSWDATQALPNVTTPVVATREGRHNTSFRSDSLTGRELRETRTPTHRSPQLWIAAGAFFSVSAVAAYLLLSDAPKSEPETSIDGVRDITKQITLPPPSHLPPVTPPPEHPEIDLQVDPDHKQAEELPPLNPVLEPETVQEPPKHTKDPNVESSRPRGRAGKYPRAQVTQPEHPNPPAERPDPPANKPKSATEVLGF